MQLARWHSIDKLTESYTSQSPYSYAGNNPINYVDILGLMPDTDISPIGGIVAGDPDAALVDDWIASGSYDAGILFSTYKSIRDQGFSFDVIEYKVRSGTFLKHMNGKGDIYKVNDLGEINITISTAFLLVPEGWDYDDFLNGVNVTGAIATSFGYFKVFKQGMFDFLLMRDWNPSLRTKYPYLGKTGVKYYNINAGIARGLGWTSVGV